MDALAALLRPEVISAMVLAPIVLQLARAKFPKFGAAHAGVLNALTIVGLSCWALRAEASPFNLRGLGLLATQSALAWGLSDLWYNHVVSRVANSSNPVLPQAKP